MCRVQNYYGAHDFISAECSHSSIVSIEPLLEDYECWGKWKWRKREDEMKLKWKAETEKLKLVVVVRSINDIELPS